MTIADVSALQETAKAVLCVIYGEEIWVPKSQIQPSSEVSEMGHFGFLVVSEWFADQYGID